MKKNMNKPIKVKKNNKMNKISKNTTATDMDQPFLTPPRIDGIAIVVDMPDPQLHGVVISEIIGRRDSGEFQPVKTQIKMYTVAVNIPCPDVDGVLDPKGPCICIMSTSKDHGNPQIRIKFNPENIFMPLTQGNNPRKAALNDTIFEYLDETFTPVFSMGFFELLSHGRVTCLDVHRQIAQRSPEDYLFKAKHAQTYQSVFGKDGQLETMLFGKRGGNQVVIYNKAREMVGKNTPNAITRIEYKLKPENMKVRDLWAHKNPFRKTEVYSLKCDKPPVEGGHWVAFLDACRFRGISNALKCQPKKHRHKLKKAISTMPVPWWEMDGDDWFRYWHDALEDCSLNRIPDHAPPLTIAAAVGMAA